MNYYCTGWQSSKGFRTAIVAEGRTRVLCLVLDSPLRVKKIPKSGRRHFTELTYKGKPYPLKRACRLFRTSARQMGITKSGKRLLKRATEAAAKQ